MKFLEDISRINKLSSRRNRIVFLGKWLYIPSENFSHKNSSRSVHRQVRNSCLYFLFLLFLVQCINAQSLSKINDIDNGQYLNVGNIALTVTNTGLLGTNFSPCPVVQPSCQYPKGSLVEHIKLAGLWVGAKDRDGVPHVSTAQQDATVPGLTAGSYGSEFTNATGQFIKTRSSFDRNLYPDAISHQDFVMDFTDKNTRNPATGDSIFIHSPLNIDVHLEAYAWNYPFADNFVLLNYTIVNSGTDTLTDVYVGLWDNAIVRNTSLSGCPGGGYTHQGKSYLDSLRMMYTFDYSGYPSNQTPANSYLGIKLLGTIPFPQNVRSLDSLRNGTFYNSWAFNGTSDATFFTPADDTKKYDKMKIGLVRDKVALLNTPTSSSGLAPNSYIDLLSTGPFTTLAPGQKVNVSFAVITAKKYRESGKNFTPNTDYLATNGPFMRRSLVTAASWAQKAYDGEDINGNNILDPGEDLDTNGVITHYKMPEPPRQPKVRTEVLNQKVILYWDRTQAEESFDPISHRKDFEGYRIYRTNLGADINNQSDFSLSMQFVAEFDRSDDSIGYNTGFSTIKLPVAKKFPGDTTEYWYRYPPANDAITSMNGWQYLYGISAFDQGDSTVASLESAKVIVRAVPGTPATSADDAEIGVYPNPYYVSSAWDQLGERARKIYFFNLPLKAEIKIFTITGDLVAELSHDGETYDGSGIKWFDDFKGIGAPAQFAGGEHAWDLISKHDQAIATGLYLFTVKDISNNKIKRGKFVVVK
jgi:hypothetical protein